MQLHPIEVRGRGTLSRACPEAGPRRRQGTAIKAQQKAEEGEHVEINVVKGRSPITGRAFVKETEPLRQRALEEKARTGRKWSWEDLEGTPPLDISGEEAKVQEAAPRLKLPSRPDVVVNDGFFAPREEYADSYERRQGDEGGEADAGELPPLFVCLGEAIREFVPTVRVNPDPRDTEHDDLTSWRSLQADPPEWARAPGGPASNVAVALARLKAPAVAFLGKVGDDAAGWDLIHELNSNRVQTRGVRVDASLRTCVTPIRLEEEEAGGWRAAPAGGGATEVAAAESFSWPEVNKAILDEAAVVHFTALSLVEAPLRATVLAAVRRAKARGALVVFDPNLPLPLWSSREHAAGALEEAWRLADVVEVSKHELEFLLGEEMYELKRIKKRLSYTVGDARELKSAREEYHYDPSELGPWLPEHLRLLIVTDGTYRIHYYTPSFHGSVEGTEDILLSPFTMDRSGSGDAIVAAIMTKLVEKPEAFETERQLQILLRYAVCAGIIAQWTLGSVKGLPTQNATQNLMEEVYVPMLIS